MLGATATRRVVRLWAWGADGGAGAGWQVRLQSVYDHRDGPYDAVYFSGSFMLLPDRTGCLKHVRTLLTPEGTLTLMHLHTHAHREKERETYTHTQAHRHTHTQAHTGTHIGT
jgi:hypothetical protein